MHAWCLEQRNENMHIDVKLSLSTWAPLGITFSDWLIIRKTLINRNSKITTCSKIGPCFSKVTFGKNMINYFFASLKADLISNEISWAWISWSLIWFKTAKVEIDAVDMCLFLMPANWSQCNILFKCGETFRQRALDRILYWNSFIKLLPFKTWIAISIYPFYLKLYLFLYL